MPQRRTVQIPGYDAPIEFPDSMSDLDVNMEASRLYDEKNRPQSQPFPLGGPLRLPLQPKEAPSLTQQLLSSLPSGRTAAQIGGATVGGAAGSLLDPVLGPFGTVAGGAAGAGAGEALYSAITGEPRNIPSAMTGGALQEAGGEILPRIGQSLAERLYQIALKPSTRLPAETATEMARTGLSERLPLSRSGLNKLRSTATSLQQDLTGEIASKPGATLNPSAVASRIDTGAIPRFSQQVLPDEDTAALQAMRDRYLSLHQTPAIPARPSTILGPGGQPAFIHPAVPAQDIPIPALEAQAAKTGTPSIAGLKYGELTGVQKEGQKQLVRGLKEELEAQFPGIAAKNERLGRLLELEPELERAINRTENRNMIGIDVPLMAGAAEAITGTPSIAAALALAKTAGSRSAILADILSRPVMRVTPAALPRFAAIPLLRSANQ